METLENTNWVVTKTDLRWRGGGHAPVSPLWLRPSIVLMPLLLQKTVLTCQFFFTITGIAPSHHVYCTDYRIIWVVSSGWIERERPFYTRSCALPTLIHHIRQSNKRLKNCWRRRRLQQLWLAHNFRGHQWRWPEAAVGLHLLVIHLCVCIWCNYRPTAAAAGQQ